MKYYLRTLLVLFITLLLNSSLIAQKKVKEITLNNINGTAIGNNSESIDQITKRAINEAKVEAMKKAGIEENIASFTDFFQSESNYSYEELFTSDILSDIRGAVKDVKIVKTEKTINEFGNLSIDVIINCTVVKYISVKDVTFNGWVDCV